MASAMEIAMKQMGELIAAAASPQSAIDALKADVIQLGINPIYAPYNAVGNGVADDTNALRAAIAALPIGGKLILTKPHKTTDTITINKKINIQCIGQGCIVPSTHPNTAVFIGDSAGILHYADMEIDLLILGPASARTYGLFFQNISNSRIKATVMCGSLNAIGLKGFLVNTATFVISVNYPLSYNVTYVMPTVSSVKALFSNVVGGYIGGCNANNITFIIEGGPIGFLVDDHSSQGGNYLKGTIQGSAQALNITNTLGMEITNLYCEISTAASLFTNCIGTKIQAEYSLDDISLVGCKSTTINLMCRVLTIGSTCVATNIVNLVINGVGSSYVDNAGDTIISGSIYYTSSVVTQMTRSAFSYNKNTVNQTGIADSTDSIITLSTASFDNKSENVFAASAFKPKLNGKYMLSASVGFTTAVDLSKVIIKIFKDNNLIKQAIGNKIDVIVNHTNQNSGFYQVYIYQTTGGTVTISGALTDTWFQGAWLGY